MQNRPDDALPFNTYAAWLTARFGHRIRKICIDAGFSCPNRDGKISTAGCIFCDNAAFAPVAAGPTIPVAEQVATAAAKFHARDPELKFIAYFQPGTNTYAPAAELSAVYDAALRHPDVVALAIGTRPDCVADEALELLADINRRTPVILELGLQSMHDKTLALLNRGHTLADFVGTCERAKNAGLYVTVHLIIAPPGETRPETLDTARLMARLEPDCVKLHSLHVVRGTKLAALWADGRIALPSRSDYVALVCDFIERLSKKTCIERLSAAARGELHLAPEWAKDPSGIRRDVVAELRRRNSHQGKLA